MILLYLGSIVCFIVKASTSEDPTVQPTTLSPSTAGGDMTESTMIYPTTTMDSENVFTTDTVPMLVDFTTLYSSEPNQGEVTESEVRPLESRIGSPVDGVIKGGSNLKIDTKKKGLLVISYISLHDCNQPIYFISYSSFRFHNFK